MTFYKYTESRFLDSFLDGHLRFQPLSYFKQQEDGLVRGDALEGTRPFRPPGGLQISKATGSGTLSEEWAFVPKVATNEIFVLCLSRSQSGEIARRFNADVCVEIKDPQAFSERVRGAVKAQFPPASSIQGRVSYYVETSEPGILWANPRAVVMAKPVSYSWQVEYRFAFGRPECLKSGATSQSLTKGTPSTAAVAVADVRVVDVGDLRNIVKVHHHAA